jgi:DNA polymerase phi
MRTWINHLAKSDRYLHAAALDLAVSVQKCVESHPSAGFPLVMQLLGPQGNRQFDRITKTKIVETLLGKMDKSGIREYVSFLKERFYDSLGEKSVVHFLPNVGTC